MINAGWDLRGWGEGGRGGGLSARAGAQRSDRHRHHDPHRSRTEIEGQRRGARRVGGGRVSDLPRCEGRHAGDEGAPGFHGSRLQVAASTARILCRTARMIGHSKPVVRPVVSRFLSAEASETGSWIHGSNVRNRSTERLNVRRGRHPGAGWRPRAQDYAIVVNAVEQVAVFGPSVTVTVTGTRKATVAPPMFRITSPRPVLSAFDDCDAVVAL